MCGAGDMAGCGKRGTPNPPPRSARLSKGPTGESPAHITTRVLAYLRRLDNDTAESISTARLARKLRLTIQQTGGALARLEKQGRILHVWHPFRVVRTAGGFGGLGRWFHLWKGGSGEAVVMN